MRKGLTLIGVLVGLSVSLLLLSMLTAFLVREIRTFKEVSLGSESLNRVNFNLLTLRVDLLKAGFGFDSGEDKCNGHDTPVYWDETSKVLDLCYVDYGKSGCESESFESGSGCSYLIEYRLQDGKLMRCVDEGADGDKSCHSLFGNSVEVKEFGFLKVPGKLEYTLKVVVPPKDGEVEIADSVVNFNLME